MCELPTHTHTHTPTGKMKKKIVICEQVVLAWGKMFNNNIIQITEACVTGGELEM